MTQQNKLTNQFFNTSISRAFIWLILAIYLTACQANQGDNMAPQQISLHFGTQGIKDFQHGKKDAQPAGAAFYDLNWRPPKLGVIKFEHGKLTSTFEHAFSAMGTVWARKAQEGVVDITIHTGISEAELITHQEAQQRMMQLIKQLLADGWQQYFFPYEARIVKQDNWQHIQEEREVIDPQQQLSQQQWQQIFTDRDNSNQLDYTLYANGVYLSLTLRQQLNQQRLTDIDPKLKLEQWGQYMLQIDLVTIRHNIQSELENVYSSKKVNGNNLLDFRQQRMSNHADRRKNAEKNMKEKGYHIDESYQDPDTTPYLQPYSDNK